jgi:hypothetical protein
MNRGIVISANRVDEAWVDADAAHLFSEITGCKVSVINDTDAAGLAEMTFGAGKNQKGTTIVLTVGTGIGSSIFNNGILLPNTELGQIQIKGVPIEERVSNKARKEEGMTDTQFRLQQQRCVNSRFTSDQRLAIQTKSVFHMWAKDTNHMAEATSFLIPLRNPVDRIVSTYRYSHPGNCNDQTRSQAPYGCHAEQYMNKKGSEQYLLFKTCFASPAMEDFAQSVKSPFSSTHFLHNQTLPKVKISGEKMQQCRKLARDVVNGSYLSPAVPHMHYNYDYYLQDSVWKYPDKEVLIIRTEHEMDDLIALDQQLGGSGKDFQRQQQHQKNVVSHGSEHYQPSPLTQEAYHKLCCVLEKEIDLYFQVLDRAINLETSSKQSSAEALAQKCGVRSTWSEWRSNCQAELQDDQKLFA